MKRSHRRKILGTTGARPELEGQTEYGTSAIRTLRSHFTAAVFYDYRLGTLANFLDSCEVCREFEQRFNYGILAEQTFMQYMVMLVVNYSL